MNNTRALVADFISDIRVCTRNINNGANVENNSVYQAQVLSDLRAILKHRHHLRLDQFGWPEILQR